RRKARILALEIIYQEEITGSSLEEIIENRHRTGTQEMPSEFAMKLIEGVLEHQEEIDNLITDYADNWAIDRMPSLDRNIIRISLYEIMYEKEIPISVSINEAVEMAKIYGTEDSGKFVNGVLGRISSELSDSNVIESK
ncbi:MAG: transcription antitermination factor NusB, partial [Dehalococcoidales bacterium]|nr:transcription antitermination factor NusB [Dehalococcoidales bacterium]